ncbi:hypothetical protein KUTeg_021774 [Tegillarca granosa]|uniref:EGF-like domain-containing protein n=1 Tax=Tegillarca granosa TaxID=220873 RepID=A0ABQ9E9W0_TEGGR|nr:hypothetical protein KUTeg_021774 [Tegillarca granosa]
MYHLMFKVWESCDNTPCENNGECHVTNVTNANGVRFTGDQCETNIDDCVVQPCLKNGTCIDLINDHLCNCTDGWDGTNCNIDRNECDTQPCQNGGQCENNEGSFRCNCYQTGYQGQLCQYPGPCASQPCHYINSDYCTQFIQNNSYICTCKSGWSGSNCDTDINECLNNPCKNGTCNNNNGSYSCACMPGFTGTNCDFDIDECATTPCKNGGKCINGLNKYTCNCSGTGELAYFIHDPQFQRLTPDNNLWIIVGPVVAGVLLIIVIGIVIFIMMARSKRATRGTYSPSRQEISGSRVELGNVMKPPPEERLI